MRHHHTPAHRLRLIARDPPATRYQTSSLADRLLDLAAECPWQDAPASIEASRLALAIAERLPAAAHPAGLTHDLRGRALASLAPRPRPHRHLAAARSPW